jgi:hypothetical protein
VLYNGRFSGFNTHAKLEGSHAFLSPSNPAWLRWTKERLEDRLTTAQAAALGTELHETAARNIRRRIKLMPDDEYPVLAAYVNDAIDLEMTPEQMLFYSFNCYGTADAISFDEDNMFLRVHDLKTGTSKASMDQLYVYAAIFCLEYDFRPFEIEGELRIYQGEIIYCEIDLEYLAHTVDMIYTSDKRIEEKRRMGGLF